MKIKFFIYLSAVIMLAIGTFYYFGYKTDVVNDNKKTSSSFRLGMNAIYVPEQKPGNKIIVSFAALEARGFVVIHEEKNEKPDAIIGQSDLLFSGDSQNILISISRNSQDGEALFAMIHQDDGDGIFNRLKDRPITNEVGESFMMKFIIDKNAVETGIINL